MSSGEQGPEESGNTDDGVGRLLAGRYRVTACLGRGGMGVVWRAVDEVLGREVAVKELRTYTDAAGPELSDLRLRMQREARAAARVRHPGVVAVHDVAEVDGRPLIVMELIDGPSLDGILRERGTLDPYEAARIGAAVTDALAAAHRAGVLHRDVKPGNILLDRSGRVVLTDFGIATMDDPGDGSATRLTRSGELVGSLDYLAPERAQGAEPGPPADVWALGATLYAAVEGASPFRRTSTYSTLTAIVSEPLPEPRRAGPLAPVLRRLMDKRPDARPDAEEASEALREVVRSRTPDTPTTTLRATSPRAPEPPERGTPPTPPGFGPADPGTGAPTAVHGPAPQAGAQDPAPPAGAHAPAPQAGVPMEPVSSHPESPAPHTGAPTGPTPAFPPGTPTGPTPSVASGAPTGPMSTTSGSPRRKGRALLAAAAVAVVLAVAGVTVALVRDQGAPRADSGQAVSHSADAATRRAGTEWSTQPGHPRRAGGKSAEPTGQASGAGDAKPSSSASASAPVSTSAEPSDTPTGTGGTGHTSSPAPACGSVGGGKYNCQVWRSATSYTASGAPAGTLKAGTDYFYCQANLGRRETYGRWTNVWWAKTDDDSGNTGVYVSDVYLKGGNNDAPVPGLPVC
ncbi:serine/threonine protein kinase [Streptomyces sp. IMTB 2501]|uniref:serine/threonine-protein kinase n=1 Tax=Streptomyces sp. IMTB 2501 TaxID=1776340 RepID=UPI000970149D|nr:serine/threonine-protein kinase [Streptomyces sp. IMTB 2501]OLZ73314.1 serine/threonine protein kinase [Streptomyces sp. IMTB 2501]